MSRESELDRSLSELKKKLISNRHRWEWLAMAKAELRKSRGKHAKKALEYIERYQDLVGE